MQQPDRIVLPIVGAEGIGADQFSALSGLVGVGAAQRAHFVQHNRHASLGQSPGGFGAGEAGPNDMDGGEGRGHARLLGGERWRAGGRRLIAAARPLATAGLSTPWRNAALCLMGFASWMGREILRRIGAHWGALEGQTLAEPGGNIPIIRSAAEAVGFLREHWRFALMVAGVGASAQFAVVLTLGSTLFGFAAASLVSAGVYASLFGAALYGPGAVRGRLVRDALRLWVTMALLGVFLSIVAFTFLLFTMGFLVGPYAQEIEAAQADEAQMQAILLRAVQERPAAAFGLFALGASAWIALTSRLFLAAPASIEAGRPRVFDTWGWTKGALLRIVAARILLLGPALILWMSVHALLSAAIGLGANNPFDLSAATVAAGNPTAFLALTFCSQILQIGLYMALEAALSVQLYRRLNPDAAKVSETFA
jgi:hypothetical protein